MINNMNNMTKVIYSLTDFVKGFSDQLYCEAPSF